MAEQLRGLFKTLLETDQVLYYWECTNSSSIVAKNNFCYETFFERKKKNYSFFTRHRYHRHFKEEKKKCFENE